MLFCFGLLNFILVKHTVTEICQSLNWTVCLLWFCYVNRETDLGSCTVITDCNIFKSMSLGCKFVIWLMVAIRTVCLTHTHTQHGEHIGQLFFLFRK
jgi:hypothetical protein